MTVEIKKDQLLINLVEDDRDVLSLVEERSGESPEETVRLALRTGARILRAASANIDVSFVEKEFARMSDEVKQTVKDTSQALTILSNETVTKLFGDGNGNAGKLPAILDSHAEKLSKALGEHFDKDKKTSVVNIISQAASEAINAERKAMLERLSESQKAILREIDPDNPTGPVGRLTARQVQNEEKVLEILSEIQKAVAIRENVAVEKSKGTGKGIDYQEAVRIELEQIARHLGDTVIDVSKEHGSTGKDGDIVIEIDPKASGGKCLRIAIEASDSKKTQPAILKDLTDTKNNRDAQASIAVYSSGPSELGSFREFPDNRIFCLFESEIGIAPLETAYKIARCYALVEVHDEEQEFDVRAFSELIKTAQRQLNQVTNAKRELTKASNGVSSVDQILDALRSELTATLAKMEGELVKGDAAA